MSTQIYIGDFGPSVYPGDIEKSFSEFGKIKDFSFKGRYAFIEYEEERAAEEAVREMHRSRLRGDHISVEFASKLKHHKFIF